MIEIKAPDDYSAYLGKMKSVFLAGSIEMGVAADWQADVVSALRDKDILILNPRRDNWDASWDQKITNPKFREQVQWELQGLEAVDQVLVYFDPQTKSPITLLELGILAGKSPKKLIVCCPEGYWRKGNVDIVCANNNITLVDGLAKAITLLT